jgi:hypothetical protein
MRRNRPVIKMLRKIIAVSRPLVMKCSVDAEDENLGIFPFMAFSSRLESKNPQTDSQLYLDKVDCTLLVIFVCTVACTTTQE